MINYKPVPTIATLGPLNIHTWGLLVSIAFIVGLVLVVYFAKKKRLNISHVINIAFISIISGMVFAHLGWLVENHPSTFRQIIDVTSGLAFFPGFLAALLFSWLYIKTKKLNFWKYADVFAIAMPLSHAIARIGCFLNWDDYGKYTTLPWAIKVSNDIPRHPTQLYHVLANLTIFFVLLFVNKKISKRSRDRINKNKIKRKGPVRKSKLNFMFGGFLFLMYIIMYSVFRFIIEFWRDNPIHLGLTASQWFSIAAFIFASIFILVKARMKNKKL